MSGADLARRASGFLAELCADPNGRPVGSASNRAATDLFARVVESYGYRTETAEMACIDWSEDGADLRAGEVAFEVQVSPYALGCDATAPLVAASTLAELEAVECTGKVLLLRGDLAKGQLMPKNFPFWNPDEHRHIIAVLEAKQPAARITATGRDPEMVGGAIYPFPLFEDGDFDIPSVYMTEEEGVRLSAYAGHDVSLHSRAARIPATGCNVIAAKGASPERRVVLFAHIDTRRGTPGAGDNASGTIVLMLLAELLADYAGQLGIELVAMNGEDYFSSPGEQQWLAQQAGRFDDIVLGINVDDVGYAKGRVAYSLYGCADDLAAVIGKVLTNHDRLVPGDAWYQGDHGLFLIHQVPALAFTSECLAELMAEITHTTKDTPAVIDAANLVDLAHALRDLLLQLDQIEA